MGSFSSGDDISFEIPIPMTEFQWESWESWESKSNPTNPQCPPFQAILGQWWLRIPQKGLIFLGSWTGRLGFSC